MKLVLACLLGLVASAAAVDISAFSSADCSGDASATASVANGECTTISGDGGSIGVLATCATEASTSSWTLALFSDNCDGTLQSNTSGSGTTCVGSFTVDCSSFSGGCYSGSTQVTLEGGATVPMSQLNIGDKVLSSDDSGNLFFDKVFRVTHWDDKATNQVVRLTAESGHVMELTANHYVHAGSIDKNDLTLAGEVEEGDAIFVVVDGQVQQTVVSKVERVPAQGLFNVHTLSSNIVANGVVGSHYSTQSTYGAKNSMVPAWNQLMDLLSPLIGATDARV